MRVIGIYFGFLKCRFFFLLLLCSFAFLCFCLCIALHSLMCVCMDAIPIILHVHVPPHNIRWCAGLNKFPKRKCVEADVLWCINGTLLLISNNWKWSFFSFLLCLLTSLLVVGCGFFFFALFIRFCCIYSLSHGETAANVYNECDEAIFFNLLRKINKANGCECVHVL